MQKSKAIMGITVTRVPFMIDKTDSGADCALFRPLPTNPDGSPLSEAKYREEIEQRKQATE